MGSVYVLCLLGCYTDEAADTGNHYQLSDVAYSPHMLCNQLYICLIWTLDVLRQPTRIKP